MWLSLIGGSTWRRCFVIRYQLAHVYLSCWRLELEEPSIAGSQVAGFVI